MRNVDPPPGDRGSKAATSSRVPRSGTGRDESQGMDWIIETIVSPFHCLYQDALEFHKQSHLRLARSEAEASRLARAAFLLYLEAAEALIHQAAAELARPELRGLMLDSERRIEGLSAWILLPLIVGEGTPGGFEPSYPPWPQLAELLALRTSWANPGPATERRAYYRAPRKEADFEPLEPHQIPEGLEIAVDRLVRPLTGLPADPYALRPRHLDTARGVLDQAIEALDKRLGGALTKDGRHRKEPVSVLCPRE
jgi:hypothetical protein